MKHAAAFAAEGGLSGGREGLGCSGLLEAAATQGHCTS